MPAGTIVSSGSLVSPGGQQGVPGPNAVSTDAGNQATFGSDNRIYVPDPTATITSVRLRSFNAVGNPNGGVMQRNVGSTLTNPANGSFIEDRWQLSWGGTLRFNAQDIVTRVPLPGTNFLISNNSLHIALTTQEPTMAAGDIMAIQQTIEGPPLRELIGDVHSVSLLVQSSVAGLKFGLSLRDPTGSWSLVKLCTIPSSGVWTLIQLPNLPIFPAAGSFSITSGNAGYLLGICLAAGSTYTASANDTWISGNVVGAVGQSNFAASPVNSTFDIAFIQHEPGSLCTTLIDKPFSQNYDECLRYFQKSYSYATAVGTITALGIRTWFQNVASTAASGTFSFYKPMAKIPTVTLYNHGTGAANSVRDGNNVDHAGAAVAGLADSGFYGITFTTATTAAFPVWSHHIADTGW